MEPSAEGNLLEIMDLARTLRQEQLFIQQEQAAFAQLSETLAENSTSITKLAYICAQQRHNLNDLIVSRSESGPIVCCRRAHNYDNAKFLDSKKVMDYEHALAYEDLFNYLYGAPYLLALSLATGDRLPDVSAQHLNCVINTISMGLYGNAINTKDVEMMLKLLRELIEIQIVGNEQPRRLLRTNSSAFARLYQRLNESMFSAKIFLTAVLYEPLMRVLSDCDVVLDVDPQKVINGLSAKERLRRFGNETTPEYEINVLKFHEETIAKLYNLAKSFIESFIHNWSLFPSTLRWLVQTMCHQLKQAHYADNIINEMIADMVFTHFICPAIISPDIIGIIDAPISEQIRFNLMQIAQIIQMLAVTRHETDVEPKYATLHAKFEANMVTNLIDMLLVGQTGEDVVAILSQQSDFERGHLVSTERELKYFAEFFRILSTHDEYDISAEERQKLKKILAHIPIAEEAQKPRECATDSPSPKEQRSKQSLIALGKVTKSKLAKSMSFNITNGGGADNTTVGQNDATTTTAAAALSSSSSSTTATVANGSAVQINGNHYQSMHQEQIPNPSASNGSISSTSSSPVRSLGRIIAPGSEVLGVNEPILIFTIYSVEKNKLQPLTEEEVLKMNSIGPEIANGDALLVDTAESCNLEHTIDKSSEANGYDGIDGMSDVLRPLHVKTTRFSLSQDDASIGNSDNLEAVSEAPSNHSVTSSLELEEEQDQNDNLSDMVSANVSGRGTPNISGRDTPSSQVTDGGSVHNALPTPQMQKLLSKARSDIEDKFCKFELKKFEGDENVSIISDTWSTDVLASDSETLDANDRERDRNFSTPLIPSAVVLPGDNNFVDALANAGSAMRVVGNYLDASDQRSESNWSTDVLASDSEKLAEVDTDDNVSITAKSDITDAGVRSEAERDMLAAAISARGVRNIRSATLTTARNGSADGHDAADNAVGNAAAADDTPGSSGDNVSDRSQEDSAFFDAVNLYDESAGVSRSYQGPSSLARSSVRTTNQYSGENSFQQNYKSGNIEDSGKAAFLATPRMRRQTSAESSISNQSLNLEDASKPPKAHHKSAMKKKKHTYGKSGASNDSQDLIDFSDFGGEEKPRPSASTSAANVASSNSNNSTNNNNSQLLERQHLANMLSGMEESVVEHRPMSLEQRNAGDDGRRNGIMGVKSANTNADAGNCRLTPSLRRHQSLNYENHEIMLNVNIPKRGSALAGMLGIREQQTTSTTVTMITPAPTTTTITAAATTTTTTTTLTSMMTSQTDDDKQQELLSLCAKANQLQLNDGGVAVLEEHFSANNSTVHKLAAKAAAASANCTPTVQQQQQQKPTKSTGAIPKSISFDASADKNSSSMRHQGIGGSGSGGQSGIFNKLKQGIFKHRRSNKSQQRHGNTISTLAGVNAVDDFGPSCSNRTVSFNPHSSEVSLEFTSGDVNRPVGFCDTSEDILAKYRRKVSTSSEATNSDSTGNGIGGLARTTEAACNNNHGEAKLPNATSLHDKALAFNVIKKKIRTVLSKTDLHSGDFRQTTYINASPLQTYLQIQLAQAINLQNFQQISYVSEAIRCIATLEPKQHAQLLEELQNDIQKRQNYLQYLMRYRQNMLLIMENLEQCEARLRSESTSCNRYLMHVCIRFYLESCQAKIDAFQEEFKHLTMSDDKSDLIDEFVDRLMQELQTNGGILHGMPEWQTTEARCSIERILLQRIYQQVMFPNDDADLSRDTVLSEHISKLQRIICPSHPALCIPQEYLAEAPWTFAQQQLSYISAYKTPREKLECVIRCISSIMSLLHMSSGRVPASDDVLPVLIYVVIMANPPYLLSTVEYISCFIGDKLGGEAQYYWTLFGSVVKFIKTMDYFD